MMYDAARSGHICLDWTQLKHQHSDATIVTVPIEAPEGVLGALTGAAGPDKPEQALVSEMQALAQSLAHSLTFCKCKSDLQVTHNCHCYASSAAVSSHLSSV